ncbi:nitroreductase/quinone reductase family protein [Kineosporia succinea]|uniref:Deazaflavin-dependent oxidoreductase (Nitroreductase family) n=1 Tax=Kineosporia succinea TaxID=84632 RepID=A0ABT9PAK9_9ACTN|nr:nitroreductase/quinone reductase family protein [Kineosporia succinea]MDP9829731.1 deazaflavin-dependent oxidoreductase (nitroreductase family) [Kineosporia succinea]
MAEPRLPPRWFIRLAWQVHRRLYRWSGGRLGLRTPGEGRYGLMRLTTLGRRSGTPRPVILAYLEDGPLLHTLAMNGWDAPEPAWWLNLRAAPDVSVDLPGGPREVRAPEASPEERERLWEQWRHVDRHLDAYAARRPGPTAVVILEPR